jgi:hypothetical protein
MSGTVRQPLFVDRRYFAMDARAPIKGLAIQWLIGPLVESSAGNVVSWQFDLHMEDKASYLIMVFPDRKTALEQRAAFQKMVNDSSAIIPLIVV